MSFLLCLETASKNCSVAVYENNKCVSLVEKSSDQYIHAEMLNLFIEWALEAAEITFKELSAIALSAGPGSYTGLRIGAASAKAFCFSLDIPLISVDTLSSLARTAQQDFDIVIPCLDARRDEIYCAVLNQDFHVLETTKALVLNNDFFKPYEDKNILIIGDGAEKTKDFLKPLQVTTQTNLPTAETLGILAYEKYINQEFEDLAYFEPSYLKNFINNMKK